MVRIMTVDLTVTAALFVALSAHAAVPANAGMQLLGTEHYAEAQAWFEAILKKNPQDATVTADMARLYLAQGKNKDGVKWAKKAVALAPRNAKLQMLLGDAYGIYVNDVSIFSKYGIARKIVAAYQRAAQLAPDSADAHDELFGYDLNAPGIVGGGTGKARKQLAILKKLDPVTADEDMAAMAMHNKKPVLAEADLRTATKLDTTGNADNQLGVLLLSEQHVSEAITAFDAGIQKSPSNSTNYYQAGRAAAISKTHVQAGIADLKQYLTMPHSWRPGTPPYKWAHYRLGMLYGMAGNEADAKAQYQAALAIDPHFKPASKALASLQRR